MTLETRFYTQVAPLSTVSQEYTIPEGEVLYLEELGGDSTSNCPVRVLLIENGISEILFSTYASSIHQTKLIVYGDGEKKIKIELENGTSLGRFLGAFWKGIS